MPELMHYAAMRQAFLVLVACCCCWAMPVNEASAEAVPGAVRAHGRNLREVHPQGLAAFLLEHMKINPVQKLIGGGPTKDPDDKKHARAFEDEEKLMGMIDQYRAQVCAEMRDENGQKFDKYDKCLKFMDKACDPGSDNKMDGDKNEKTSGEGYCREFFPGAEKKARDKLAEEDKKAEEEKKKKEGKGGITDTIGDAIGVGGTSDDADGETGDDSEASAAGRADSASAKKAGGRVAGVPAGDAAGAAAKGDGSASAGGKDGAGAGAGGDAASGAKAGGGGGAAAEPAGAAGAAGDAGAAGARAGGAPGGDPAKPAHPAEEGVYYTDGGKKFMLLCFLAGGCCFAIAWSLVLAGAFRGPHQRS